MPDAIRVCGAVRGSRRAAIWVAPMTIPTETGMKARPVRTGG